MQCPVCSGVDLVMSERNGVEIDYCPKCRGVWLDRGELDKIIERSSQSAQPSRQEARYDTKYEDRYDDRRRYEDSKYRESYHKPRKRESFLGELFDF